MASHCKVSLCGVQLVWHQDGYGYCDGGCCLDGVPRHRHRGCSCVETYNWDVRHRDFWKKEEELAEVAVAIDRATMWKGWMMAAAAADYYRRVECNFVPRCCPPDWCCNRLELALVGCMAA